MMAAVAKNRDRPSGSITTGGIANAQTFVSGYSFASIPTIPAGIRIVLKIGTGLTNTGATTLNMDGLGTIPVKTENGADLVASMLVGGGYAEFRYDGTNWVLLGFSGTLPATTINGDLTVNGNSTVTGTLGVTGALTAGSSTIAGNESVGGALGVTGALTAGSSTIAGNESVGGTLTGHVGAFRGAANAVLPSGNYALKVGCVGADVEYGIGIRPANQNGYHIVFINAVTEAASGSISDSSGSLTSYNVTCDGNLKTDIVDLGPLAAF